MKKILIAGSMLAALSTSALAEHFYIRVDGGASFREKLYSKTGNDSYTSDANESKTLGQLGLGFGGYIADNVRADLNFTYFFNANYSFPKDAELTTANELLVAKVTKATFGPAAPTTPDTLAPLLVAGAKIVDPVVIAAVKGDPIVPLLAGATDLQKSLVAVINSSGQSQLKALKIEDLTVKSFSIMPRLYYDFWNFGAGNMFFGIGLGYANASASIPFTPVLNVNPVVTYTPAVEAVAAVAAVAANPNANPPVVAVPAVAAVAAADAFYTVTTPAKVAFVAPQATLKTKTANNFAWSAHLGFDYKLESMEGVKLNVEYYYSDMGKLGKWTLDSTDAALDVDSNLYLRSHNVTVGLRFDM